MKILVVNAGSSSLKYQVIDMTDEKLLAKGLVEITTNHTDALNQVLAKLTDKQSGVISDISEIGAVGHRVLHAAEDFSGSIVMDDEKMKICRKNEVLGPLHMPPNLNCVDVCRALMPNIPNVAVFDTAFHSTMPKHAYMYAIPYADYEKYKVRKYGFHGTSHKFVSAKAIEYLGKADSKIITCHLGNGSSMAAVRDGKCIDTSMGLTPLEGMIMGTRSGDIDPAAVTFLANAKGISADAVVNMLNKESGYKGICGISDFRAICDMVDAGHERATLVLDMFAYRIKKYIGGYIAALGGLDCIVFTGGIGENAPHARAKIMEGLECFGVDFDFEKSWHNPRGTFAELHKPASKVKVLIVPTNEELEIARQTKELLV
jgi:acetate kinase